MINKIYPILRYIIVPVTLLLLTGCSKTAQISKDNEFNINLNKNWSMISSKKVKETGQRISSEDYKCGQEWYAIDIPSTVLGGLVKNGEYDKWYFSTNLEKIPKNRFKCAWWFRKEFNLHTLKKNISIYFNGINYRADIFLNGSKIASSDTLEGSFRVFKIDITNHVVKGKNTIALKVFPPRQGDFTIGFVDWNPLPPDRNMGIWRGVTIRTTGVVSMNQPFVETNVDENNLQKASIYIKTKLINHSMEKQSAVLKGRIGDKEFKKEFIIPPKQVKNITMSPADINELSIKNPKLWWPNGMGPQNLYNLELSLEINGKPEDSRSVRFGIRSVSDYLNKYGYRGYKINGKKVLIRGAAWVDDLFLSDSDKKVEAQLKYAQNMNLNCIRLEGFWGSSQKLYDFADKYGILIMAGWSCQWEWENYLGKPVDKFGGVKTREDMALVAKYLKDQVVLLRNHPSVFVWALGSDLIPRPALEKKFSAVLSVIDTTRPVLLSCSDKTSTVTGIKTGVKMTGPYDYVPPVYWYTDKENGGAFGFNTETVPGPQPPPIESLKKMVPEKDIWPIADVFNYHNARYEFSTMNTFINALDHRYGKSENISDFLEKSQIQSYEAARAMFESYILNQPKATGVIFWMMNSAWPETFWQLFDWFLRPNGAFYGTMKANQPLNLIYNYADNAVYAVNLSMKPCKDMKAEITLLNKDSKIVLSESKKISDISANGKTPVRNISLKEFESPLFFLDLKLLNKNGDTVSNNFYWLSKKKERMDFTKTIWYVTPVKEFADFSALNNLEPCNIEISKSIKFAGKKGIAKIKIKNVSDKIAFFIEAKLIMHDSKDPVLPVFWNDNYISLLPGDQRELVCEFYKFDTGKQKVDIITTGFNLRKIKTVEGN